MKMKIELSADEVKGLVLQAYAPRSYMTVEGAAEPRVSELFTLYQGGLEATITDERLLQTPAEAQTAADELSAAGSGNTMTSTADEVGF